MLNWFLLGKRIEASKVHVYFELFIESRLERPPGDMAFAHPACGDPSGKQVFCRRNRMGPQRVFREERLALLARLCRLTPYRDDAEDALQEAILAILSRSCRQEDDSLLSDYGLLYVIAKRRVIDAMRHRHRWAGCSLDQVDFYTRVSVREQGLVEGAATREAFATLSEADQRLLLLHSQGWDCTEIAQAHQLPKESIKKRLQRARRRFDAALCAAENS